MNPLISICVTTRHRPALLKVALEGLTRQKYRPLEIIIGDNSENDDSRAVVESIAWPDGVTVHYHRHQPSTDVVQNTNWAFDRASGGRIMLHHDDDVLCDGGLDKLVAAWDNYPNTAATFGKLYLINEAGELLEEQTEQTNREHCRTAEYAGHKLSNLESGLRGQFPMNSYLMDAALLKRVKWRPLEVVGIWTDGDFGIQAGIAAGERPFVYVDEFVFKYRLTTVSLVRSRDVEYGHLLYLEELKKLKVPLESEPSWHRLLETVTRCAVVSAARAGNRTKAFALLRSVHYNRSWLHPATLYRIMYILSPALTRTCNRIVRGLPS